MSLACNNKAVKVKKCIDDNPDFFTNDVKIIIRDNEYIVSLKRTDKVL